MGESDRAFSFIMGQQHDFVRQALIVTLAARHDQGGRARAEQLIAALRRHESATQHLWQRYSFDELWAMVWFSKSVTRQIQ